MQVKELKNDGLSYELEVIVEAKEIDKHVDDKLKEYGKTVSMPGFRPGKVPMDILKQRYGKAVLGEVLELAVNDSTMKVLKDKGLRPALQPKIEVKEFDEGKDLKYSMEIEVMPEFEVMELKGMTLEKSVTKADKEAVEETLENMAKSSRQTQEIKGNRAAKEGDVVIMDFHGKTTAGDEYPGMSGKDHKLELGSGQFIPGFEEQLIGKKKGDKVKVEVTFPEDYHMTDLAEATCIFDVDIKEIHEAKEIKIDDDFAKTVGFDNVKTLREAVESQIQGQYDQMSRMKLKRQLLDILDDAHDFELPAGMLDLEYENILQQVRMDRQNQLKDSKLELSKEEEEELRAISVRRVRLGMVLSEIGQSNNIKISDQELQRAVMAEAQRYPGQEAEVFEHYRNTPQALEALRAPVFEDKVVDFIIELADVTEKKVSVAELTMPEDEEAYYAEKKKSEAGKDKSGKSSSAGTKSKKAASKDTKKAASKDTKKAASSKKPPAKTKPKAKSSGTKKKSASGSAK